MSARRRYLRKPAAVVVAVQLDLETEGFCYEKWGATQRCKPGDWLVDNGRDVYTVDRESFARTYRRQSFGVYAKVTPVWAEVAATGGQVETKEGVSRYEAGDYIVYNDPDGRDGYALSAEEFERMYEPAPGAPADG